MSFSGENTDDSTVEAGIPLDQVNQTLEAGEFLPDIDFNDFITVERINREYRVETITHCLLLGIIKVHEDIEHRLCEWVRQGYEKLIDVPTLELGTVLAFELQYKEAVYVWAKCILMQEYATMNRKDQAENIAKELNKRCPELMQRYADAIAYLTDQPQGVVTSII